MKEEFECGDVDRKVEGIKWDNYLISQGLMIVYKNKLIKDILWILIKPEAEENLLKIKLK